MNNPRTHEKSRRTNRAVAILADPGMKIMEPTLLKTSTLVI